jgi:hypothetical protein
MVDNGRGAWNNAGLGGTKKYKDSTKPGPYYFIGTGKNIDVLDPNQYAVRGAVKAYQNALNREFDSNLTVDGWFGEATSREIFEFQRVNEAQTGTPWGGIGPDTSRALLYPQLRRVHKRRAKEYVPVTIVSGTVRHESAWDAGAVGFIDPRDVGLGQINAQAHPEWSVDERLVPILTYQFIIDRYNADVPYFKGNVRDAVAAYNLGRGGAIFSTVLAVASG